MYRGSIISLATLILTASVAGNSDETTDKSDLVRVKLPRTFCDEIIELNEDGTVKSRHSSCPDAPSPETLCVPRSQAAKFGEIIDEEDAEPCS